MKKAKLLALYLFVSFALTGCKIYSFTGGNLDPNIKTISIAYFPNNALIVQPTLSQTLTDALKDKFTSQTKLKLLSRDGDISIDGSITGYTTLPVAIQGNETAALNRLTITISVKFTNTLDEKMNFEQNFSRYEDYVSSKSLSDVETALIKDINDALVDDVFNKAVVNW